MTQRPKIVGLILIAALISQGCRTLPQPYHALGPQATMAEREAAYQAQRIRFHWTGLPLNHGVGGPGARFWDRCERDARFYEASGDTVSAAQARQGKPWLWVPWAGVLTGLACAAVAAVQPHDQDAAAQAWFSAAWVGVGVEIAGFEFTGLVYRRPAAKSYNAYLRRQLGLDDNGMVWER